MPGPSPGDDRSHEQPRTTAGAQTGLMRPLSGEHGCTSAEKNSEHQPCSTDQRIERVRRRRPAWPAQSALTLPRSDAPIPLSDDRPAGCPAARSSAALLVKPPQLSVVCSQLTRPHSLTFCGRGRARPTLVIRCCCAQGKLHVWRSYSRKMYIGPVHTTTTNPPPRLDDSQCLLQAEAHSGASRMSTLGVPPPPCPEFPAGVA